MPLQIVAILPALASASDGPAWSSLIAAGLNVVLGAFVGALLGYAFSRFQRNQEARSKQALLLEHLRKELSLLSRDVAPSDPDALDLRLPIRVTIIPRLLDGVLEYRKHGALIDHLIVLEQLIGRYNDWILLTNETQTLGRRSRSEIYQMQQRAEQLSAVIVDLRDTILPLLSISGRDLRLTRDTLEDTVARSTRGISPRPD